MTFNFTGQPRCAIGYNFQKILSVLLEYDLIDYNINDELIETMKYMKTYNFTKSLDDNFAKTLAQKIHGKQILMVASDFLEPVARRWKCQFSEISKSVATMDTVPEMNHNTIEGLLFPSSCNIHVIFLESDHTINRNKVRIRETANIMKNYNFEIDIINMFENTSMLTNMWALIHLGDYVSYYLAMLNKIDPTPVNIIEKFKNNIKI